MYKLLLIAGGGAVGALLRYGVSGFGQGLTNRAFPLGTLIVNALGCLLIGILGAALITGPFLVRDEYRAGLFIGILGAFTTFSTFSWETFQLAGEGQYRAAALNVVLNNAVGLLAVGFGYRLTQKLLGV